MHKTLYRLFIVRFCGTGQKLPWDGQSQKGIDKSLNHVSRGQNGPNQEKNIGIHTLWLDGSYRLSVALG